MNENFFSSLKFPSPWKMHMILGELSVCTLSDVLSAQSLTDDLKALIRVVFFPPNRPHSCLLSSYRHSSDVAGAKAVG